MKNVALLFFVTLVFTSCKQTANEAGVVEDNSKQATIDSMNVVMEKQKEDLAKQQTIDSMQAIASKQQTKVIVQQAPAQAVTPAEAKRKGWSGAAKGAVIGAGAGAIGGALINKKDPATGAVIGGLGGAGIGAGTGAILDSEKKRKAEEKK